jgi:hypothetical protein
MTVKLGSVIASVAKQSMGRQLRMEMDCFAALAMTAKAGILGRWISEA